MSETALLWESLRLLVIGMGIVFGFLVLLVGILRLMSWAVLRLAPMSAVPHPHIAAPGSGADAPPDAVIAAVITAAIARYRERRGPGRR